MATPEENMAAALARAEKARSEGKLDRAATWEASADRYKRLIDIKKDLEESKARVEKIKEGLSKAKETPKQPDPIIPKPLPLLPLKPKKEEDFEDKKFSTSSFGSTSSPLVQKAPTPTPPTPSPPPPPPAPVKTAPIDTILFDDTTVPIEIMTDLIFEDIGGQEIISIVRNDTVNGQNIVYQPIKNLSLINQQYNPNNVLALQGTSDKYFENFIIKLPNKIPSEGSGSDGRNVYINNDTLDIVVDLINIELDEQTEFQFRIDGTIYEAEL